MVVSKTTKLFKWAHPALGTISFVCKTVSKVGDKFCKNNVYKNFIKLMILQNLVM